MNIFIPCTIIELPKNNWISAAETAIKINPDNAPAVHLHKMAASDLKFNASELGAAVSDLRAASARASTSRLGHSAKISEIYSDDIDVRTRLAIVTSKFWGWDGVRLTVGFLDNPAADLRARILFHMNAWSAWANVSFVESNTDPQVRITRVGKDSHGNGGGYWSALGTDILHRDSDKATMNLEGFTMATSDSEFYRVVRHETGHTLGFPHEHLRSEIVDRIDREKAIAHFMKSVNWTREKVIQQVLTPLGLSAPLGTLHADTSSIMCYWLPSHIMKDGNEVKGGTDIDDQDAQFAALIYHGQQSWCWCRKCNGLHFTGNSTKGACPSGGTHDSTNSGNYSLVQNAPSDTVQNSWCWCNKCQGLYFAGNPTQGMCPSGGAHDHKGSGNYGLAMNRSPSDPGQKNWRWCRKCEGLHFAGFSSKGACPAGGEHTQVDSGDYSLLLFTPAHPLPANYGSFDCMNTLPNGKTYATFGNQYVRYSDPGFNQVDAGYPKPIAGNWGSNMPAEFLNGFDSMATLPNGKTYVTKGSQYICYSDENASNVDTGYPRQIKGNWGNIPKAFESGFDSMATLPDGKIYITKGNQYIRYSDKIANNVDAGYPRQIKGNWGNIPKSFESGFDSMAALPNGKIYIMRSGQYIRYSDPSGNTVDPNYPRPILGNWG